MNVLVVDDNDNDRYLLRRLLRTAGYVVRSTGGCMEALRLLDESPCPVMVTDLNMPEMDGLQLAREAIRAHPETAVVLCTGDSTADLAERARQAGVLAALPKPVRLADLLQVLGQIRSQQPTAGRYGSWQEWTCPRCGTHHMGWSPLNICSKCGYRDGAEDG